MCAFVMMALTAASTAMSAAGSIMQGQQADKMGRLQQMAYQQQAENDRVASGYEAVREFERSRAVQSQAITEVGASGVALTGSPVEALADNAVQNQLDIDAIRFGSKIRQGNLRTQGDLARITGQQRKQAGYIGAAATVLGGAARIAGIAGQGGGSSGEPLNISPSIASGFAPSRGVYMGGSPFGSGAIY
jgi:hypothetical protein